jgi:hypothetical protein
MKRILTEQEQLSLSAELAPAPEPPRIPEVDEALDDYLESDVQLARARDEKKNLHETLLARMDEHGLIAVPYVERTTNKRKLFTREAKLVTKIKNAPKPPKRREHVDRDDKPEKPTAKAKATEKVESRRVSRKSVEREIDTDPFAATRSKLEGVH